MTSHDSELAVAVNNVDFHWGTKGAANNDQFCFENLSFEVKLQEKVFLFGESGSGKSTLLALISGTILPSNNGRVEILGVDTSKLNAAERDAHRAEHMGVIFQMFNLIPYLSAIDNILLPLNFAEGRAQRAGGTKHLQDQEARMLMEQLDLPAATFGERKPAELSVGQQQRVAAARAFIGKPELIIADEPTSALDRGRQKEFMELLFGLVENSTSTLIMVSHDEGLADRFDRTVCLHESSRTAFQPVMQ